MMPGTVDCAVHHQPFRQGAVIMGAMGRDGENIFALPHQQDVIPADMAHQQAVFRKSGKRDTAAEIRACGLGIFLVHIGYPRFSNLTPKPPEREID